MGRGQSSTNGLTVTPSAAILNHMVVDPNASLDAAFQALAHPTRRAMLRLLAEGERTVSELAAPFRVSLAASSKHVKLLERAGLIRRRIEGRTHTCSLVPEPLRAVTEVAEGVRAVWEANFRRLDALLDELKTDDTPETPR